ncbi:protein of unknown function DUF490 [Gloeothece citriformis PCC 7424]|uniref:Translocation and assembly module TamB C-terminal domain-containing protein n=1 Tax=Gloeothece citriformis (strain PCC 7424) TaxID=65393 RepID=B7KD93_GLOC7|nr:translocation/assembly module TamB domain-containing protein [Gloeothece citriformis]ACK68913.1 protein of unknown function DUF490 [Gloeothece citriformis PCC 7424]
MTSNSPDPGNSPPNPLKRLLQTAKQPKAIAIGITSLTLIIGSSVGFRIVMTQTLPQTIEKTLSDALNREVKLGKVENYSLTHLKIGFSSIPETPKHLNQLTIENIDAQFNPLLILLQGRLPVKITLSNLNGYIKQDQQGNWTIDRIEKIKLPIDLDASFEIKNADLQLQPSGKAKPVTVELDGKGNYLELNQQQQLGYDFTVALLNSQIHLKGNTRLPTGKTEAELKIEKLALPEIASLIPHFPLQINQGQLNTNVNIEVPSLTNIENSQGQGNISLNNLTATNNQLKQPIKIVANFALQDTQLIIQKFQINWSEIKANIQGNLDWKKGLDLAVNLQSFNLSDISKTFSVSMPFLVGGNLQSQIRIKGELSNPIVTGTVKNTQNLLIDKVLIKDFKTVFQANLNELILKSLTIKPVVGGEIQGQGTIKTQFKEYLNQPKKFDWTKLPIKFTVNTNLPTQKIVNLYYPIPSEVQLGNLKAKGELSGTLKRPQALLQWQLSDTNLASTNPIYGGGELLVLNQTINLRNTELTTGEGKITLTGRGNLDKNLWQTEAVINSFNLPVIFPSNPTVTLESGKVTLLGTFDKLNINNVTGLANLFIKVNEGTVILNSQLKNGQITGSANLSQLALNPFLPKTINTPVKLTQTQANFSGSMAEILANDTDKFSSLNATANLSIAVNDNPISIQTTLDKGIVNADIKTGKIPLSPLLPNLTIPINLTQSQVNVSGKIGSLLSFLESSETQENDVLKDIKLTADAQINIDDNIIKAQAFINNNQWQSEIYGSNISHPSLCPPLQKNCPPINTKINLSGNIDPLFQQNPTLSIQAKTILLEIKGQTLEAQGDIIVENIDTIPDARLNLGVEYRSDLKSILPLDEFISQIPIQQGLLLDETQITGETYFKGQLVGTNLLTTSNPLENIQLTGNAQLTNLSINKRVFEPIMRGIVNVSIQQEITVNLRGKQDIFAFTLERCSRNSCLTPYLPNSFQVLQSYNAQIPIQLKATRQGEILSADLENFPLELLQITPIRTLGFPTRVTGNVDANLQINLFTLAGTGNLTIDKPGIGNITAESFETELVYDNRLAKLQSANLQIGQSRYQLDGSFDIKTQELQGKLQINEGEIQDLLEVTNVASLINPSTTKIPQTTTANQLQPYSIGGANTPISEQLNQIRESEQKIRQQANQIESGLIAPILDLQGKYRAEIDLGGTLENPEISLQFEGKKWQWFPKPQYVNFLDPLGLIIQEPETIPLEKISLQGHLEKGELKINYQSEIGRANLALNANLVKENNRWNFQDSSFNIENLSLDLLRYFFESPIDINGEINAQGKLQGNPLKPEIITNFAFTDGTLNGRPLNIPVEGNLTYINDKITLKTLEDSKIKIYANVPYPIEPQKNDRLELDLKLTTEVFTVIDLFSQGKLNWVGGEGEINLKANGRINLAETFKLYDLNTEGQVTLNNATLQASNLERPLIFNGQLMFNNQHLEANQLKGNILDTQVAITGILPLFEPIANNQNPLTISLINGQIDSPGRYRGEIDTNLIIKGSVFNPIIGGNIRIYNGQILLSRLKEDNQIVSPVYQQWYGTLTPQKPLIKPPQLNNFQVALENIELIQDDRLPQYKFDVSGELNLNGDLLNLESLQPRGKIRLNQGKVYILTTDVFLANQYENTLTFFPEEGLFNPYLDLQLKAFLWDIAIIANNNNEIPDDIVKSGRQKSVELTVTIQGEAEQLYAAAPVIEKACQFPEEDSPINPNLVPELSQQLTDCLRVASFADNQSDLQLLKSPVVSISSNPPLTQNEINVLFDRKIDDISDPVQQQNTAQLVEIGIPQVAVTVLPFLQQEVFELNEAVSLWAKSTFGLERFQIVPVVQTGYKLNNGAFVRISYDYFFNEMTVRYETRW